MPVTNNILNQKWSDLFCHTLISNNWTVGVYLLYYQIQT